MFQCKWIRFTNINLNSSNTRNDSPPNICETVSVSAVTLEQQRGARPYADSSSGDHEGVDGRTFLLR